MGDARQELGTVDVRRVAAGDISNHRILLTAESEPDLVLLDGISYGPALRSSLLSLGESLPACS